MSVFVLLKDSSYILKRCVVVVVVVEMIDVICDADKQNCVLQRLRI